MKTNLLLSLAFLTSIAFAQSSEDDLFRSYAMEIQENEFSGSTGQRRQSINDLSSRLQAFQQKLKAMEPRMDAALGRSDLQSTDPSVDGRTGAGRQNVDSLGEPYPPAVSKGFGMSDEAEFSRDDQPLKRQSHRGNVGVYVLPFIALQGASHFDASIPELGNSPVSIKQKVGFSSGWRIGKRWKNFFIDADFSYFRNKLKKPSVNTLGNLSFSGTADGYGGMLNLGGNINPGTAVSILLGAGVGAFNQEIQANIPYPVGLLDSLAMNFNEADTLFAYQLFTGMNFYPTERTLVSMKYRWLTIEEMEKFSARSLHLLELAFGYVF